MTRTRRSRALCCNTVRLKPPCNIVVWRKVPNRFCFYSLHTLGNLQECVARLNSNSQNKRLACVGVVARDHNVCVACVPVDENNECCKQKVTCPRLFFLLRCL